MNWVDITILSLAAVGALLGALSGLLWQVARLVTFCAALYAAIFLHAPVGNWITKRVIDDRVAARVLAYVTIFIAVYIVLFVATWLLEQTLKAARLKKMDRLLGALLGILKAFLIAGAVLMASSYYPLKPLQESVRQSVCAPYVLKGMKLIVVGLPPEYVEKLERFLQNIKQKAAETQVSAPRQEKEPQ